MEKLITLFLTLGLAHTLQSANLEVEIPWNYEQIKADGLLLQQYEESQKIDFKISDEPIIRDWVLWNAADIYTTHRAISGGYARELNPLLPDFPSLERLIIHKLLVNYMLYQANFFEDRELTKIVNDFGWIAVANNTWIIIDNE